MVHLIVGAQLHGMTKIHHQHAVGNMLYDRQIVGDENQRQPHFPLQLLQQVNHLCLNRHVQRGDRLIADNELRFKN